MNSYSPDEKSKNSLLSALQKLRNRHLFLFDIIAFSVTPILALLLRLDGKMNIASYSLELGLVTILFFNVKLWILWSFGFYRRYWRYASIEELIYITLVMVIGVVA